MADGYYPDGILEPPPGFDYRVGPSEPEMAYTSIGLVPITAVRGGIKYPKGTAMPSLNHQLTALKNKQENLAAEIANLERKVKAQRTPPPITQNMWTITVRFTRGGSSYTYLILRHGGKFYTTGTNVQDSTFRSWDDLLVWLDGVAEHGAMIPLRTDYDAAAPLEGRRD